MQGRFTHLECFIDEEGRVIAQGRIDGRMFILDSSEGGTVMLVKGQKLELDIGLWHKQIGLQDLQSKQVVFGLPKFSCRKAQICEAVRSGSSTDFLSPMSEIGAGTSST